MSSKFLYSLPTTLLANNLIIDTSQIDLTRIISKNIQENKEILKKEEFQKNLQKLDFPHSNLLLPVNVIIFDKYYKRLSEWKYWDKYTFENNVLVFDKKQYDSEAYQNAYKKVWLSELKQLKDFKYYKTNMRQFPYRDDSLNINWIDGKASEHKLKNILSLSLPKRIEKSFEVHDKIIQLNHAFRMDSIINFYSGYWKNGELKQDKNVISGVEYGNLKLHYKRWNDMYHNFSGEKINCQSLAAKPDRDLKDQGIYIAEGFDSKCDQIQLLRFWSYFWNNRDKNIYSSGYAGYKNKNPNKWNHQYFFYSLGEWILNRPIQYQVNEYQGNNKKIWYVDFDDIFIPEIKIVEDSNRVKNSSNLKNEYLQLSIYLNYDKIDKTSDFWKISPYLNYQMKFKLDGRDHNIKFQLKDILGGRTYKLENTNKRFSDYAFSNFELLVNSDNSKIKLVSEGREKAFKYKLNLSIIKQRFNLFHSIFLDQDELKNFYYSELKNKEKWEKIFKLVSTDINGDKDKLINFSKDWLNLLNIKIIGKDFSPSASIEYYDFLAKETKKVEFSNLLFLPNFSESEYIRRDKFSSIQDIITSQTKQKIGKYFWNHIDLKLIEKDILGGVEKYLLISKNVNGIDRDISNEWIENYRNTEIIVKNHLDKYLIPKTQISDLEKIISSNNLQELFSIHKVNNQKFELQLSDFIFSKTREEGNYIDGFIEYKGNSYLNKVEQVSNRYQRVNLSGKTKFKINKRDSYIMFPENSQLPFYFSKEESISKKESFWKDNNLISSTIIGALGGGGLVAGLGTFLSKKLRLTA